MVVVTVVVADSDEVLLELEEVEQTGISSDKFMQSSQVMVELLLLLEDEVVETEEELVLVGEDEAGVYKEELLLAGEDGAGVYKEELLLLGEVVVCHCELLEELYELVEEPYA